VQTGAEGGVQRILLLDEACSHEATVTSTLSNAFPQTEVFVTDSLEGFHKALGQSEFDIVVLDYDLPDARGSELLAHLRVRDHEPDVLIVSKCDEPETIRSIAQSRKRYVVRDDKWVDSLVLALRDMIRIRRLEREMSVIQERLTAANAKLEEKNRRLDDFCATIAHDIRGPLASLILKTEYIVDAYQESLDQRCTRLLTRAAESAHRLIGVVQGMYEFAKVGAGIVRFEMVDLRELVSEVIGDLNIEDSVEIKIGVGSLPNVWGNPSLLRRVFVNLLSNSIKYSDKEEVCINLGCEGEVVQGDERFVKLYVEDNGPGIASEEIATIFEMFKRGRSHKDQTDGMGIGLAVVQRVVELHHGTIELTSERGHGCRFTFLLPTEIKRDSGVMSFERETLLQVAELPCREPAEVIGPIRQLIERV
jgi:signal transduction histidine kinase